MAKATKKPKKFQIVCRYRWCDPEWETYGPKVFYIVDLKTGWRTQQEWETAAEAHDYLTSKLLKRKKKR